MSHWITADGKQKKLLPSGPFPTILAPCIVFGWHQSAMNVEAALVSSPRRCVTPRQTAFVSPRRKKRFTNNGVLTKDLISRAFVEVTTSSNRECRPIFSLSSAQPPELTNSFGTLSSGGMVAVECGLGLSPRRPRRADMSPRGLSTPRTPRVAIATANNGGLLHSIYLPSVQNHGPLVPKKEELIPAKRALDLTTSSPRPVTTVGQKQLSREGLQKINSHKLFLSDMRTPRRKVMFLPDKENKTKASASPRIANLSISDLSLPGGCVNAKNNLRCSAFISGNILDKKHHYASSKVAYECNDKTEKNKRRKLRSKLRKSERMIKRLDVLMEKDELLVQKLRLENQELRRELICLPTVRQSQKLLTQEIEELEVQLKNLAVELEVLREWESEEQSCDYNSIFSDEHILGGTWNPFPQTSSPRRGKRVNTNNNPTLSEALERIR